MLATEFLMQELLGVGFRNNISDDLLSSFQKAQELERNQIANNYNESVVFISKKEYERLKHDSNELQKVIFLD